MMTGSGSPCGACKFLRRKCAKGCVFAPYFCHEQGAAHFAAIHKVFGASNVSKLLSHLPINERCDAAVTISYEAQARLQNPIHGCVSHIFALQQQVVSLQSQLASLRHQATYGSTANRHDAQGWFQSGGPILNHTNQQNPNFNHQQFCQISNLLNMGNYSMGNNYGNSSLVNNPMNSLGSFEETSEQSFGSNNFEDDPQSAAFGYFPNS